MGEGQIPVSSKPLGISVGFDVAEEADLVVSAEREEGVGLMVRDIPSTESERPTMVISLHQVRSAILPFVHSP